MTEMHTTASLHDFEQNGGKIEKGAGHAALLELRDRAALMPGVGRSLEAAATNIPGAGALFDSGVRLSAFEGFSEMNTTYGRIAWVDRDPSDVVAYEKLRPLPQAPIVIEGEDVPKVILDTMDRVLVPAPYRAESLTIGATTIRADKSGMIAQKAMMFGKAMAWTLENVLYDVLTVRPPTMTV